MKQTYSLCLSKAEYALLRVYLKENNIIYEPSQMDSDNIYITLSLTSEEVVLINNFVDEYIA